MVVDNTQIKEGHFIQKIKFSTTMGMTHKGVKYNEGMSPSY
jgi:hypothetical protein